MNDKMGGAQLIQLSARWSGRVGRQARPIPIPTGRLRTFRTDLDEPTLARPSISDVLPRVVHEILPILRERFDLPEEDIAAELERARGRTPRDAQRAAVRDVLAA